jgi:tetratricopeptide (TPR) repeat protein
MNTLMNTRKVLNEITIDALKSLQGTVINTQSKSSETKMTIKMTQEEINKCNDFIILVPILLMNQSKYSPVKPVRDPERSDSIRKTKKSLRGAELNLNNSPGSNQRKTIRAFSIKGAGGLLTNSRKVPAAKHYYQLLITTPKGKKIEQIDNIRKTVKDEYIKITPKTLSDIKDGIYVRWTRAIKILLSTDIRLALSGLKIMGDIYIEFDEPDRAKNVYLYYKFLAYNLELLDDYMYAYESLGNAYKFLYRYRKAIACYKKQIELAWKLGDKYSELRAYDNIGIQYFYLNNKEKAKYYHKRFLKGKSEAQESDIRSSVVNRFNEKHFNIVAEEKLKHKKTNEELKSALE